MKYEIRIHRDGYVVIPVGGQCGVSTHANILDALHVCRIANRFIRSVK